jgi:hypothetical protein
VLICRTAFLLKTTSNTISLVSVGHLFTRKEEKERILSKRWILLGSFRFDDGSKKQYLAIVKVNQCTPANDFSILEVDTDFPNQLTGSIIISFESITYLVSLFCSVFL